MFFGVDFGFRGQAAIGKHPEGEGDDLGFLADEFALPFKGLQFLYANFVFRLPFTLADPNIAGCRSDPMTSISCNVGIFSCHSSQEFHDRVGILPLQSDSVLF